MKARLKKLLAAAIAAFDIRDVFVFGGIAGIAYGLSLIYIPVGWIVPSAIFLWLGVRR